MQEPSCCQEAQEGFVLQNFTVKPSKRCLLKMCKREKIYNFEKRPCALGPFLYGVYRGIFYSPSIQEGKPFKEKLEKRLYKLCRMALK